MSITITPVNPVSQAASTAQAAPDLVLTPGTVVDARVLAVRDANMVRIAIEGLAIDVLSEVALQPGTTVKLAVSQNGDGVRLAVVPQDQAVAGKASATGGSVTVLSPAIVDQLKTAQPGAQASSNQALPNAAESAAIARAVQTAAPKQAGLSPLFANLPVIVASDGVPQPVQNAAAQLLTARPQLDTALTADDLRQAFQKSGLLLESSLARGVAPSGTPDLKAALVVFRQVLSNWLGQAGTPAATAPQASPQSTPAEIPRVAAPPLAADVAITDLAETIVRQSPQGLARELAPLLRDNGAQALSELLNRSAASRSQQAVSQQTVAIPANGSGDLGSHEPAPPFRGAALAAQPIAQPSIDPDATPVSMGRQLLDQTDGAIARQTLLQVASLPDRPELAGPNQNTQPRWSFEIPFATPQGTAVAQFEISRDGGKESEEASSSSRVWRARFTLDVEPTGPVHALVSLIGEKTAVRMWAERPETAAQLRASTDALGHALRQAELEPGDILVGEGAPPRPVALRAGQFLDRAT